MKKSYFNNKIIKRTGAFLLAFLCIFSMFGTDSHADFSKSEATEIYRSLSIEDVTAQNVASADTLSGQIIISGTNGRERVCVGNLVKLTLLLIAFEKIDSGAISLTSEFQVSKHAQDISVGKVRVYLDSGKHEVIRVEQAVEAICINGAYDAACALAEFLGGTEEGCVALMNAKVAELGLKNTYYTDATGLNTDQYSCAEDIAVIFAALVGKHPDVLNYLNLTYGTFFHESTRQSNTEMVSSNPLNRKKFYEAADGSMTGYSSGSYSIACTVASEERRVVSVVVGAESENLRAAEVRKLAEYSLSNYEYTRLAIKGTFVKKVNITDGKEKKIKTETADDFYYLLNVKDSSKVKTSIELNEELKAPVEEGTVCGYVVFYLEDEELGRVELVTSESMARANWFTRLIRKILAFFGL